MKNPKKIVLGSKASAMTPEEQAERIYRDYALKHNGYMEAAIFNLLGNSSVTESRSVDEIIALGAEVAEKMIDAVPKAVDAALDRKLAAAAERAEAEAKSK